MEFKAISHEFSKKVAIYSAWFVSFFGILVVLAWLLGLENFVTFPTYGFILSYVSAITILIFGICFLNLIYAKKLYFYKFLAFPILILSILRIYEIAFSTDFGISKLLAKTLYFNGKDTAAMLLGGALNAFFTSCVFLFWPQTHRTKFRSAFINFNLLFVVFLFIEGIVVYLLPIDPRDFILKAPIHPLFAIIQLVLSMGLLCYNFYQDDLFKIKALKWFPFIFAGGALLFHFFLVTGLLHEQRLTTEDALKAKAYSIEAHITQKLVDIGAIIHRFSSRVELEQNFKFPSLKTDTANYLASEDSLVGICWFDKNLQIIDYDYKKNPLHFDEILANVTKKLNQSSDVAPVVSYFNKESTLLCLFNPLVWQGQVQGAVLFEVDLNKLINETSDIETSKAFSIEIYCDGINVYSANKEILSHKNSPQIAVDFSVYDLHFKLAIQGTKDLLIDKIIKSLVIFIILGGVVGSLLSGIIIFLFQTLHEKMMFAQKVGKQLLMSNEIMKVMNEVDTIDEACDKILKVLYEQYGWSLFLYWQMNNKIQKLELVRISSIPKGVYSNFEKELKNLPSFENTLFKKAFDERETMWIDDFSKSQFHLAKMAEQANLKGAFALPVYQNKVPFGVIELFKKEPFILEPEVGWIELMKSIGNEFSYFIERREAHLLDKELNTVVKNSTDAIYKVNLDLTIKTWNLGAENIYGWKAEEIIGKSVDVLYPKDRIMEIKNIQTTLLKFSSIEHFTTQRIRKDGTLIWVENSYSPIISENNKVLAFSVITRDITKEKKALDELKLNEEKFRLFVDSTKSWIWEMDTSGVYTFSNQATSKLIGYDASEIVGKNWLSFSLAKEKLEKDWNSLTSTQKGWRQKLWQVKAKNGSLIWLESTADPIFDADKKWIGYRGVDRDVTDEVMINKTKNEFISMVSHELRTPLTSIIGAMGLLKNNPQIPGDLQELITVADRNAERLLRLINDILDIEKLNLGKMQLSLKVQDLSKVVEEALKVAQSQANLAGIEIVYDKLLPNVLVNIDSDRTLQVILNLLSNAIKFSHQGSKITLSLSLRGHLVRLSIMDEGQGIDYDIQGKLFEKFIQAEAGDTKVKGTGLGLNISKGIIEQMGGTINFISEPGKGSTFFFDLPIVSHEE